MTPDSEATMTEANELVELLELQQSTDLITKSELLELVRQRGCRISDRNLTYYASEGLIPAALRLGRRGVVYPRIAADQLSFVIQSREADLSLEAIRELLPLWKALQRGIREERLDLCELEIIARNTITKTEANFAVPMLVNRVMNGICHECRAKIVWTLKDGSSRTEADDDDLTLTFVVAALDEETKQGRQIAWTQLRLPGIVDPSGDEPTTIILGIPNGIALCKDSHSPVDSPAAKRSAPDGEEVTT
jgi:DNA-binding transcriptional MerR regulator